MPSLTPPPSHLDGDQIQRLEELLDQRAVPFKGFNLEALDGFLSALVLAPEDVPMAEWQPVVWGMPPRWADAEERLQVEALLQGHYNMATQRVRLADYDLPDHLVPLLWLPEDPEAVQGEGSADDALDIGRDWASGFFRGVELREAAWERWLDDNEWMDEVFALLDRLASGEVLGDDPAGPSMPITYRERLEIVASLPGMLADLHRHRIEALTPRQPRRRADTPDRNDPCSCGSGRKYKKCCGAIA